MRLLIKEEVYMREIKESQDLNHKCLIHNFFSQRTEIMDLKLNSLGGILHWKQ